MPTLLTIAEAAPQFRKSQDAMRYWLRQDSCPIPIIRLGSRRFITQESIDAFYANLIKEVA